MRRILLPIAVVVHSLGATAGADARPRAVAPDPFLPAPEAAVGLVRAHKTNGYVTVAETLAYAERVRAGRFRLERWQAVQRAGEPFTRVYICYRLGDPVTSAAATCGIGYAVSVNPPHVELARPQDGLARDLQAGREAFLRAIDHELGLRREPLVEALRDAVEPINPYDWR
ncbi:hypothetical protein [Methylobacterium sp. A54F]